jgi:hypothetical protein
MDDFDTPATKRDLNELGAQLRSDLEERTAQLRSDLEKRTAQLRSTPQPPAGGIDAAALRYTHRSR